MSKSPQFSFKVYANDRLKPVSFHGQLTAPLYIRVILNGRPTYFKSAYFDQLASPKYIIQSVLGPHSPVTEQVIDLEHQVLTYIGVGLNVNADVDTIKDEYYYLSRDLLSELENGFQRFLVTFFQDEGLPMLAFLVSEGGKQSTAELILNDLKKSLDRELLSKLLTNAVYYAPAYIPFCEFVRKTLQKPVPTFSVFEWSSLGVKSQFIKFLDEQYPQYDFATIEQHMQALIVRSTNH